MLKGKVVVAMLLFHSMIVFCDRLWTLVRVSTEMIDGSYTSSQGDALGPLQTLQVPKMRCGTICDYQIWCLSWCYVHENNTCFNLGAMISPLYVTDSSETYNCYTNQERDFVVGAYATAPPPYFGLPTRIASNLVLGIYNYNDMMTCCHVYDIKKGPWILIKLKTLTTIRENRVTTPPYYWFEDVADGSEIRVGKVPPVTPGNFTNFELFGKLPIPAPELTTYSFKKQRGVKVKYISIQKIPIGTIIQSLHVCQVMAF